MNKLVLVFAAGLTLAGSGIAVAQPGAAPADSAMPSGMSAEQQTQFASWTDEQRTAYRGWTQPTRDYYWSLTPTRQTGWWRMTEEQRGQVFALDAAGRANAWKSIEAQVAAAPAPAPAGASAPAATDQPAQADAAPDAAAPVQQAQANPTGEGAPSATPPNPQSAEAAVPPAMPSDPGYHAGPYKGAMTEPPAQAMNKEYPLCSRTVTDSCINPSEAGAARHTTRARSIKHRRTS